MKSRRLQFSVDDDNHLNVRSGDDDDDDVATKCSASILGNRSADAGSVFFRLMPPEIKVVEAFCAIVSATAAEKRH